MACGCLGKASEAEVFKDSKERWCTDILFLILLIFSVGASIAVCGVSIAADPSLITDLIYPTDRNGANCGKDEFSDRKKIVYPRLDSDFLEQYTVVATGQWWNFKPTGYCTEVCPSGFDLANPTVYGGPTYPCSATNCTPSDQFYYYTYPTKDMLGRCIPSATTLPAETRNLCIFPNCTSATAMALNVSSGGVAGMVSCTSVDSQPNAKNTWQVCPAGCTGDCCTAQQSACSGDGTLQVTEAVTETFMPHSSTDDDIGFTQQWATYVQLVLGGYEGLVVWEGIIALTVFGVALPIMMGFVWAVFLWFFAGIVVYVLIGALVVTLLILDFILMIKAGFFEVDPSALDSLLGANSTYITEISTSADDTWKTYYTVFAVIMIIVTVMFLLFLIINRKCIGRLIAILQETTKVFKSMFGIVLWPFFDLVLQTGVFVFGFFAIFFAANAPDSLFSEWGWKVLAVIFQVFIVFWMSQFVRATVWTSMSAAICRWYVTDNAAGAEKPCCGMGTGFAQLASGTCLILCKHLGSMAFGALIIATIQTIRAIVQTIDYYTQDVQKNNCFLSLCLKCIQYCLACIQKTVEMISYYGFVFVAMRGDSFCKACYETMAFIIQYPAQTALNKTVAKVLNLLIGWSTPVLSAACAFWYLEYGAGDYAEQFNTMWAAGVTFIIAFIVTSGITMIYDCAIDTIYLCAFKDMAENDPPKFMSDDLRVGFGLAMSQEEAYTEAGVPVTLATKHKSQTQRKREKAQSGPRYDTANPAVSTVSAANTV